MSGLNGGTASANVRNSHYVRLTVPELGFGSELDAMVQFFLERGEELRTGCITTKTDHRDWIYFRFHDPNNAKHFAGRFNGQLFIPAADDFTFP
jgi:hypothetical protein